MNGHPEPSLRERERELEAGRCGELRVAHDRIRLALRELERDAELAPAGRERVDERQRLGEHLRVRRRGGGERLRLRAGGEAHPQEESATGDARSRAVHCPLRRRARRSGWPAKP